MARQHRRPLVRYASGSPEEKAARISVHALITGTITVVLFFVLINLAMTRPSFDVNVSLNYAGIPAAPQAEALPEFLAEVKSRDGIMASYILSFRNLSSQDLDLNLTASIATGRVALSPDRIVLAQGDEIRKVPVRVKIMGLNDVYDQPSQLLFRVESRRLRQSITKKILFIRNK
jgi:hypothetical protein